MLEQAIKKLKNFIETIPTLLLRVEEASFSYKSEPKKWSKKEILGHLIDSAINNHQRFVRGQFEDKPIITYNQDKWVECNYYQEIEIEQLISFWTIYNKQLLEVATRIPTDKLKNEVNTSEQDLTIEFLLCDYVDHLEYHLMQIIENQK